MVCNPVKSDGVVGNGYSSAGEFARELEHDPENGSGEAERDNNGVCVLMEATSDGGESSCTGLHKPDDSALPILTVSETLSSSAAPSLLLVDILFIGGDDFALPNCANH